jgi:YidC/Oxa1 family membrane protein insertase
MIPNFVDLSLGFVAQLLAFFYEVVRGSFGGAIILLTLAVMVFLMPLTLKATKSTIKMTQLQPKLRQLQKKYKDDKQTLNQEMMALYQAEGVNPVGGCLPMLAQMPVLLMLFTLFRGLARHVDQKPFYHAAGRAFELAGRSAPDGRAFDPAYLDQSSQMYQDLTDGRTSMDFGPFDLGATTSEIFSQSFVTALPYLGLILLVVGSSYYQQRQISARRGDSDQEMTQQQKTQQQLIRILPLMSGAWSFIFPTGLVLYWATSNLFRIGQQGYITRSLYSGDAPGAKMLREQAARRSADGDGDDSGDDKGDDDGARSSSNGSGKAKTNGRSGRATRGASPGGKSEGEAVKAKAGGSSNGATDGGSLSTREERWAARRAEKAKIQARRSGSAGAGGSSGGGSTSSRITPKGTKPTSSRKNKRKR